MEIELVDVALLYADLMTEYLTSPSFVARYESQVLVWSDQQHSLNVPLLLTQSLRHSNLVHLATLGPEIHHSPYLL